MHPSNSDKNDTNNPGCPQLSGRMRISQGMKKTHEEEEGGGGGGRQGGRGGLLCVKFVYLSEQRRRRPSLKSSESGNGFGV